MSHMTLQRHPKCSALYASRHCHDSEVSRLSEAVAPCIAYFANVTVEVTAKTSTRDASTFALTVHDAKSSSTWRHLLSYAECRAFQSRVLKMLSRGHFCFAECPWLYAYVQRALPVETKSHHLLRVGSHNFKPHVGENQRQALARLFATLQRVLLNPLNHKCSVLMQQVAPEVIAFITNRSDLNVQEPLNSPSCDLADSFMFEINEDKGGDETFSLSSSTTAASFDDLDGGFHMAENAFNTAVDKVVAGQRVCCAMCALHKTRSDEQVFACWRAGTTSSRFWRLRAGTGIEQTSGAKLHSLAQFMNQKKDVMESPAFSQRVTSPLEPVAAFGCRGFKNHVMVDDGTPKEPFPESPRTPCTPLGSSSSRTSSVYEIDHEMLDNWQLSVAVPSPVNSRQTAFAATLQLSEVENNRQMPRRSLRMLSLIRSKFTTSAHC